MVDSDDRDFAGVVGTVAAAAFTVVVGGAWVQAGAHVVGVAFGFFGSGFFFDFPFFSLFALQRFLLPLFRFARPLFPQDSPPRRFMPSLPALLAGKDRSPLGCEPMLPRRLLPGCRFAAAAG